MSRKIPVGYEVRRPLTLWGQKRTIGEYIPAKEVASMVRIESMVRSGRFIEVFDKPNAKALHGRKNTRPAEPALTRAPKRAVKPAPKKSVKPAPQKDDVSLVVKPEVDPEDQ